MTDINPTPSWAAVRQLEIGEFALGGANGNMNEQAKSLAARSEFLKQRAAYQYNTLAEANADIANIALNQNVNVVDSGRYYKATAGATSLTKSSYDPLTQAKAYTNTFVDSSVNPERSGWAHVIVDQVGQILGGYTGDGKFVAQNIEVVTELLSTLSRLTSLENSIVLSAEPARTGIVFAVLDSSSNMFMHLRTDGQLYVGNIPAGTSQSLLDRVSNLESYFNNLSTVVCYGDSLTAGAGASQPANFYPSKLGTALNRQVSNNGIGGQGAVQISARANGYTALISLSGNQIPASGSVAVTSISPDLLSTPADSTARSIPCIVMGIAGTLARDSSNNYTFTRTTNGSAVPVYQNSVLSINVGDLAEMVNVIWSGTNDSFTTATDKQIITDAIDQQIAALQNLNPRWLVLSPWKQSSIVLGSATYTEMVALHNIMKRKYKDRFVPLFDILINSYNPSIPQDVTDYTNGVIPSSLRSDPTHLNDAGYQIVANTVAEYINRLGF